MREEKIKRMKAKTMHQTKNTKAKPNLVERWKRYVIAGNHSLIADDLRAAALQYELARQCAETLFNKWAESSEAVSALVVTYHNIADLHRKQGNAEAIKHYLQAVHTIVLRALASTPIEHNRHGALLNGSKRTYSALVSFNKCGVYS